MALDPFHSLYPVLMGACPGFAAADLNGTVLQIMSTIKTSMSLFERSHIYPLYTDIVYDQTCDNMMRGLGWVFVSTALTALFLLPTVVLLSHRYLTHVESVRDYIRKKAEMEEAEKQRLLDERSKEAPVVERSWWSCCTTK